MAKQEQRSTTRLGRPFLLFGLLLAATFLAHGVAAAETRLPLHPSVVAWAEGHPGEPVPLIVQHDGTPDDLLTFVADAGGSLEREFHIIPAIDIDLPASELGDLARQDDVTWFSLDAPVQSTAAGGYGYISTAYPFSVNAPEAWSSATGSGVTVALIDTGVSKHAKADFSDGARLSWVTTNSELDADEDGFGHGSHVGGIIAGASTETSPAGKYTGIAPGADLLSIRIADDDGTATVGDLMAGLEFVDDNREALNIRVLNLSVTSSVAQSYTVDPIDAAVELLWFHDVAVVVAAGNDGDADDAVHYPPANDPFVITVGAFDDQGTADLGDDALASWSSRGNTQDGYAKPEVLAPGANIVSTVSGKSYLAKTYPQGVVEDGKPAYFRMSGTSMATGVVSGVVALARQAHPEWTPGDVKTALMETARSVSGSGEGVLADAVVDYTGEPESADDGITPSYLLLAAAVGNDLDLDDEAVLDGIRWRDAEFEGIRWRGIEFEGIRWRQVDWSGIRWRGIEWSGIRWRGGTQFEGIRWRGIEFEGIRWRAFVEE